MTTRTSILALAALAAASISTLAPTSASAWGLHTGGYGGHNGGVFRPVGVNHGGFGYGSIRLSGVNHGGFGYGSVRPAWYPRHTFRPWFGNRWTFARPYWRPSYQVGPAFLPSRPVYTPSYPVVQPTAEPCDEPTYVPQRQSYIPAATISAEEPCETVPARTAMVQYR